MAAVCQVLIPTSPDNQDRRSYALLWQPWLTNSLSSAFARIQANNAYNMFSILTSA